ncbi:MAG: S8 family serine peptidase, partial [bacterium]
MYRVVIVAILASIVAAVSAYEYLPGRMIITIKPEYELKLTKDESGFVKTGIKSVDELNEYFGVVRYEPLLGPLGKYEEKWKDFRNHLIFFFADTFVNVEEVSKLYDGLPEVRDAHPEYLKPYKIRTPNDPMYFAQWYLPKCELPMAWDFTVGRADGLLITAIDSGLDWDHPEIMPMVWVNPGEDLDRDGVVFDYDDINLVDDDWNGLVDDIIGYDFVDGARNAYNDGTLREDGMTMDNDPSDFILDGHGTMCTGLFLAATNNEFGIASTNWSGKTIALRAGYFSQDSMGYNLPSAMIRATRYAIDMGVKIISFSYGSFRSDPEERDIINAAWNAGCIIIAAAGNESTSTRVYPAAYNNVIAVGSTDVNDKKSTFSNYGNYVDIMAPGERMYMVYPDGFQTADGTSFAAPLVAGIVRLIWSYFPDSSRDWVINRLLSSADPIDSLNPDSLHGRLGVGRVNAYKAIAQVIRPSIR